jgi:type IV secretory pathway VirB3-like protein
MGVFNFMETFFFISLGISFILIIMIVYHFKQRIIVLEQKQDTMFEIINNIVKQIKNMQVNITYLGESQNHNLHDEKMNMVSFSHGFNPMNMNDFNVMFNDNIENDLSKEIPQRYLEEEYNNSEHDTEHESDEDSDSEDESEDESEEDSEDESDEDITDPLSENVHPPDVKIISVDIDEKNTDSNNLGILQFTEINATLEKINELREEDIVIHKINDSNNETEHDTTKDSKDFYKRMSLSVLKTMVIEKGLSTDPSKLKKHELVKLLDSSE